MLEIITSTATVLAVAVITGLFARESRRYKKDSIKIEKRAARREVESLLSMRLTSANTTLSLAIARAVKEGKSNGDLDLAVEEARKAQLEYYDFVNREFARNVAKV